MMSRFNIVFEILRKVLIQYFEIDGQRIETFLPECSIESFNVRIVVRLSYSRVTVTYPDTFCEACTELTSIIGLYTPKEKWCSDLCLLNELRRCMRIRFGIHSCICPSAIHINAGKYIENRLPVYRKMYRIGLY